MTAARRRSDGVGGAFVADAGAAARSRGRGSRGRWGGGASEVDEAAGSGRHRGGQRPQRVERGVRERGTREIAWPEVVDDLPGRVFPRRRCGAGLALPGLAQVVGVGPRRRGRRQQVTEHVTAIAAHQPDQHRLGHVAERRQHASQSRPGRSSDG